MLIAVEAHNRLWFLKIGCNDRYRKQAPGILLTHHMIRNAVESGLTSVEFLGFSERWVDLWQPREHRYRSSQIYPCNLPGLLHFGADGVEFLIRRIRRSARQLSGRLNTGKNIQ